MAEASERTVLRRKAEAGRMEVVEAPPLTPERALGQGLARAAQDLMGMALRTTACREARMTLADMPETLPDYALIALVEGPGDGLGLVAIAPDLLGAAIEMLTIGKLGPRIAPPRRPTRTDASMTAELVDRFLVEIEALLAPLAAAQWALGYSYASFLEDPRPLGLLLEDVPYRVFTMELDLGTGPTRPGRMIVALPADARGPDAGFRPRAVVEAEAQGAAASHAAPEAAARTDAAEGTSDSAAVPAAEDWHARMEATVLGLPADVEAVLHRLTLPLSAVMDFKPGMDIPIPVSALENLRIEGLGHRYLARARLGQNRGFRAIRISATDQPGSSFEPEPSAAQPERSMAPVPMQATGSMPAARAVDVPAAVPEQMPAEVPAMRIGAMS